MTLEAFRVFVAGEEHFPLAAAIAAAIAIEVERGVIGMALRSVELLTERMRSGDALIALPTNSTRTWAGFCYISPWDSARFVSTSALIVHSRWRGRGVARRLKEEAVRLSAQRYPGARPFGLTTSAEVAKINRDLGFEVVTYDRLPRDPEFWKGCLSCPHHDELLRNHQKTCRCTATLLPG